MKKFNAKELKIEATSAFSTVRKSLSDNIYPAYIGLDVHKERIAIAVAYAGRNAPNQEVKLRTNPKR